LEAATRVLEAYAKGGAGGDGGVRVDADRRHVGAAVERGARLLAALVRDLDSAGIEVEDLGLRRPTLDDVFLALTGHAAEETDEAGDAEDVGRSDEREIA
jgi:ABC-2 type transport system ATP-binding protein